MKIKWGNIFGLIVLIIVLVNAKPISKAFHSMAEWFTESLDGLNDFSPGAQTAIAFTSIVLVIVVIFKSINK